MTLDLATIKGYLTLADIPSVLLVLGNMLFILILIRWHVKEGQFDFRKALLDPATNAISFSRLGQLVALVSSTEWGMYEALKGRLSEWFVMAYLSAWAGVAIYGRWQTSQDAKQNISVPRLPDDPRP